MYEFSHTKVTHFYKKTTKQGFEECNKERLWRGIKRKSEICKNEKQLKLDL